MMANSTAEPQREFLVIAKRVKNKVARVKVWRTSAEIVITTPYFFGLFAGNKRYVGRINNRELTFDWYYQGKMCISNEWAELNRLVEDRKFLNE